MISFSSKKGRARRKKRREERRKRRSRRKQARAKRRSDRKEARHKRRMERKESRRNARQKRIEARQETKQVAYQNGMDPNAWVGDVAKGVTSIGAMAMGIPPRGNNSIANLGGGSKNGAGIGGRVEVGGDNNTLMIMGAGAVALLLLLKK